MNTRKNITLFFYLMLILNESYVKDNNSGFNRSYYVSYLRIKLIKNNRLHQNQVLHLYIVLNYKQTKISDFFQNF